MFRLFPLQSAEQTLSPALRTLGGGDQGYLQYISSWGLRWRCDWQDGLAW